MSSRCPGGLGVKPGGVDIPKPKAPMRNMHHNIALRNVYAAVAASLLATLSFYFLHNRPRKQRYRDFYAEYDADKAFERMRAAGVLSSCPPEAPEPEDKKKKK